MKILFDSHFRHLSLEDRKWETSNTCSILLCALSSLPLGRPRNRANAMSYLQEDKPYTLLVGHWVPFVETFRTASQASRPIDRGWHSFSLWHTLFFSFWSSSGCSRQVPVLLSAPSHRAQPHLEPKTCVRSRLVWGLRTGIPTATSLLAGQPSTIPGFAPSPSSLARPRPLAECPPRYHGFDGHAGHGM